MATLNNVLNTSISYSILTEETLAASSMIMEISTNKVSFEANSAGVAGSAISFIQEGASLVLAPKQDICMFNIAMCDSGFTTRLSMKFNEYVEEAFIYDTGAYKTDGYGITIRYEFEAIQVYIATATKVWTVTCTSRPALDTWFTLSVSWHEVMGVQIYINDQLAGWSYIYG
eukprot:GHVR01098441.1.p1 GENE.GHVR01098441.1~~GHVR01098441.1.p1  ORF type:complete len:172 (-),score=9.59 GHVR01098441.1:185-700(-)